MGGLGAAGWWLIQPGPETSASSEAAPVAVAPEEIPAPPPLESAVPPPVVARAVPAESPKPEPAAPEEPAPPPPVVVPGRFSKLLALDAMSARKTENKAWAEEAWQLARSTDAWDDYRDLLGRSLQAYAAGKPTAEVVANPQAGPALIRHAFLTAAPAAVLKPLLTDGEDADFILWLLENPDAMQAFLRQLSPHDDVGKALKVWAGLAAEQPSARTDFRELAIACALVFDRPVKADHDRYGGLIDPLARFNHFRENSEAGRLTGKVKTMPASDLVWVVGVPVAASELEWALKKADFRRKTWGVAYGSIKYDMEKAVNGVSPYDEYTFAEIQKEGGVCSDQSYFSAWTACAHGIPAAIISGDGSRGPHAWMTWLADEGEWEFSGRMGGYPAGTSRNPQTGKSISEEEFLRMNDRRNASRTEVAQSCQSLWLAAVLAAQPEQATTFLEEAVKTAPRFPVAAAAMLAHWKQHRGTEAVAGWTVMIANLRKNFRDCAELMEQVNEAETQFVFARSDSKDVVKNLRREARKVEDTATGDAGVEVDPKRLTDGLRRQAEVLQAKGDPGAIRSIYGRALDDHGNNAATFKAIAKDYFSFFKQDAELAARVCFELESVCRRQVGRGKGDWFDVTSQNSAWMLVSECYRTAGDTSKADRIAKDCESRTKTAKNRAV